MFPSKSVDIRDNNGELHTAIRIKDLGLRNKPPTSNQEHDTSCHIRIVTYMTYMTYMTYTTYSFVSEADTYVSGRGKSRTWRG